MSEKEPRRPCPGGAGCKRQCWSREGSLYCANHDPVLAEARRANGCKRVKGPPVAILRTAMGTDGRWHKPEHVRPAQATPRRGGLHVVASGGERVGPHGQARRGLTRGEARERKLDEVVERAEKLMAGPAPTPAYQREVAEKVLVDIALYGGEHPRVAAAKALVEKLLREAELVAKAKADGDGTPPMTIEAQLAAEAAAAPRQ